MGNIEKLLALSEDELINEGKLYSNKKDIIDLFYDEGSKDYDALIQDEDLFDRIRNGAMNISQLHSESDKIIPIYAFFQKYAKVIMHELRSIEIDNIDVSQAHWKHNFLNECNQKILSSSMVLFDLKYAMYQFYEKNPMMLKDKMPFIEIANAAGITYILSKYNIDKSLLQKTAEERKQRWEERMKRGSMVMNIDDNSDPESLAQQIKNGLDDKNQYLNSN